MSVLAWSSHARRTRLTCSLTNDLPRSLAEYELPAYEQQQRVEVGCAARLSSSLDALVAPSMKALGNWIEPWLAPSISMRRAFLYSREMSTLL